MSLCLQVSTWIVQTFYWYSSAFSLVNFIFVLQLQPGSRSINNVVEYCNELCPLCHRYSKPVKQRSYFHKILSARSQNFIHWNPKIITWLLWIIRPCPTPWAWMTPAQCPSTLVDSWPHPPSSVYGLVHTVCASVYLPNKTWVFVNYRIFTVHCIRISTCTFVFYEGVAVSKARMPG